MVMPQVISRHDTDDRCPGSTPCPNLDHQAMPLRGVSGHWSVSSRLPSGGQQCQWPAVGVRVGSLRGPFPVSPAAQSSTRRTVGPPGCAWLWGWGQWRRGAGGRSREVHGKPLAWGFHPGMETSQ